MMRAYVSIRGSRSPRRVDRDASPEPRAAHPAEPYAALCFPRSGGAIRFELSYVVLASGLVRVVLRHSCAGREPQTVYAGEIGGLE